MCIRDRGFLVKDVEYFRGRYLVPFYLADIVGMLRQMLNGTAGNIAGKLDRLYLIELLNIPRRTADNVVERQNTRCLLYTSKNMPSA